MDDLETKQQSKEHAAPAFEPIRPVEPPAIEPTAPVEPVWRSWVGLVPAQARQSLAALLGVALGFALIAGLVVGLRTFAHVALSTPTPSVLAALTEEPTAAESPTETAAATASAEATATDVPTAAPSPTPTPGPTQPSGPTQGPAGPDHPAVLASVDCMFLGAAGTASGRLYAACADNRVVAINLTTGKVAKTYPVTHPSTRVAASVTRLAVKDVLWIGWSDGLIQRYDLSTGKVTGQVSGDRFLTDGAGNVWIETPDGAVHAVSARSGMPASGSGTPPSAWICGGNIWVWNSGTMTVTSTSGAARGSFAIGGGFTILDVGPACWYTAGSARSGYSLTNLTSGCLGSKTVKLASQPFDLGTTTWMLTSGGMVQVALPSGAKSSTVWKLPGGLGLDQPPVYASGQIWTGSSTTLVRLDIPLRAMAGGTLPATVCPTPSPTPVPTPTPAPTEAPTAAPTDAATPTPAPTATPVPTATPAA